MEILRVVLVKRSQKFIPAMWLSSNCSPSTRAEISHSSVKGNTLGFVGYVPLLLYILIFKKWSLMSQARFLGSFSINSKIPFRCMLQTLSIHFNNFFQLFAQIKYYLSINPQLFTHKSYDKALEPLFFIFINYEKMYFWRNISML